MNSQEIAELQATVKRLEAENLIYKENQEKLLESREKWKQKTLELNEDISALGGFVILFLGMVREIQPINKDMNEFIKKYEFDKLFEPEKIDGRKNPNHLSKMMWAAHHSLDVGKIMSDIQAVLNNLKPVLETLGKGHALSTLTPAMATVYKYASHAMTEDEQKWFLDNTQKLALSQHKEDEKNEIA